MTVSLSHLLTAVPDAGLVTDAVHEIGAGPASDLLDISAHVPADRPH